MIRLVLALSLLVVSAAQAGVCDAQSAPQMSVLEQALCKKAPMPLKDEDETMEAWTKRVSKAIGVPVMLDVVSLTAEGRGSETIVFKNGADGPAHEVLEAVLDQQGMAFRATPNVLLITSKFAKRPDTTVLFSFDPKVVQAERIESVVAGIAKERKIDQEFRFYVSTKSSLLALQASWEVQWYLKAEAGFKALPAAPAPKDLSQVPVLSRRIKNSVKVVDMQLGDFLPELSKIVQKEGYPAFTYNLDTTALTAEGRGTETIINLNVEIPAGYPGITVGELVDLTFLIAAVDTKNSLTVTTESARDAMVRRATFNVPSGVDAGELLSLLRTTVFPESWEPEDTSFEAAQVYAKQLQDLGERMRARSEELEKAKAEGKQIATPQELAAELQKFRTEALQLQTAQLQQEIRQLMSGLQSASIGLGAGQLIRKHTGRPEFTAVNAPHVLRFIEELLAQDWSVVGKP
ncbi:hypothetical protein K2X33_01290 [bacterium]|nr:hypothetical protein [bacterium]